MMKAHDRWNIPTLESGSKRQIRSRRHPPQVPELLTWLSSSSSSRLSHHRLVCHTAGDRRSRPHPPPHRWPNEVTHQPTPPSPNFASRSIYQSRRHRPSPRSSPRRVAARGSRSRRTSRLVAEARDSGENARGIHRISAPGSISRSA
jgi:hypothetical protein